MCAIDVEWQHFDCIVMTLISTTRYERILDALKAAFRPDVLEIIDESAKHAGHAGRIGSTASESHFKVVMVSSALAGMSRLARSRAVHEALSSEFETGLHALSLQLQAPDELSSQGLS
jgi:BolA protein